VIVIVIRAFPGMYRFDCVLFVHFPACIVLTVYSVRFRVDRHHFYVWNLD
jgi:hypothetical protein